MLTNANSNANQRHRSADQRRQNSVLNTLSIRKSTTENQEARKGARRAAVPALAPPHPASQTLSQHPPHSRRPCVVGRRLAGGSSACPSPASACRCCRPPATVSCPCPPSAAPTLLSVSSHRSCVPELEALPFHRPPTASSLPILDLLMWEAPATLATAPARCSRAGCTSRQPPPRAMAPRRPPPRATARRPLRSAAAVLWRHQLRTRMLRRRRRRTCPPAAPPRPVRAPAPA